MELHSVSHLDGMFKLGGQITLNDYLTINNIKYNLLCEHTIPIRKMVLENKKSFMVYSVDKESKKTDHYHELLNQGILNEWIVLVWDSTTKLSMLPAGALTIPSTTLVQIEEATDNIITDEVQVVFDRFGKTIKGKVDTGANMSSIHVDHWQILPGKNKVQFTSHILSENNILMDVIDQIVVKTSEGSEYRPVVQFQISIGNVRIKDAQFNLNNRSGMQHPILIGQNILERGKFLIDPTKTKDMVKAENFDWTENVDKINWEELQEKLKDVKCDPYFHTIANSIIDRTINELENVG